MVPYLLGRERKTPYACGAASSPTSESPELPRNARYYVLDQSSRGCGPRGSTDLFQQITPSQCFAVKQIATTTAIAAALCAMLIHHLDPFRLWFVPSSMYVFSLVDRSQVVIFQVLSPSPSSPSRSIKPRRAPALASAASRPSAPHTHPSQY